MTDEKKQEIGTALLTTETAKAKIKQALTAVELSFQKLQTEVDALVMNEDHLVQMKALIDKSDKIDKLIETEHKKIKKPFKDQGDAADEAKRDLLKLNLDTITPVKTRYVSINQELAKKERERVAKESEDKRIKDGINANIMLWSERIVDAKSKSDLDTIHRQINVEKNATKKYGEFYESMVEKANQLLDLLKEHKLNVKEAEKTEASIAAAEAKDDDRAVINLTESKGSIDANVQQGKIDIQEKAIAIVTAAAPEPARQMWTPASKPKKRIWKYEIIDENRAYIAGMLRVEADPEKNNEKMKQLRESDEKAREFTANGIRYYEDELFI